MNNQLTHTLAITGVLCAVNSNSLGAEGADVEQRLKQLENTVQTLQKENTDLRKELGWTGGKAPVLARPGGKEQKLNIGGYLQLQGEAGRAPDARFSGINDRFLIRRARLGANGRFMEDFDFKIEGDFGNNSISGRSGYSAQITDVFINYNRYSFANIKLGQFKTPFGYEQLQPDTKILTVERSLPNDRLTSSRQIGLGVSGDFFEKRLGYSVGAFNGNGVNNGFNDNDHFLYAGRVTATPLTVKISEQDLKWNVGFNALSSHDASVSSSGFGFDSTPLTVATDNLFGGERTAIGFDTQVTFAGAELQFEYLRGHYSPANDLPESSFDAEGFQVTAAYFVVPKYLQALVKYETFNPNTGVDGDSTDLWTFGINYCIKGDDLKLSVNYVLGNPAGGTADGQGRIMARAQLVF